MASGAPHMGPLETAAQARVAEAEGRLAEAISLLAAARAKHGDGSALPEDEQAAYAQLGSSVDALDAEYQAALGAARDAEAADAADARALANARAGGGARGADVREADERRARELAAPLAAAATASPDGARRATGNLSPETPPAGGLFSNSSSAGPGGALPAGHGASEGAVSEYKARTLEYERRVRELEAREAARERETLLLRAELAESKYAALLAERGAASGAARTSPSPTRTAAPAGATGLLSSIVESPLLKALGPERIFMQYERNGALFEMHKTAVPYDPPSAERDRLFRSYHPVFNRLAGPTTRPLTLGDSGEIYMLFHGLAQTQMLKSATSMRASILVGTMETANLQDLFLSYIRAMEPMEGEGAAAAGEAAAAGARGQSLQFTEKDSLLSIAPRIALFPMLEWAMEHWRPCLEGCTARALLQAMSTPESPLTFALLVGGGMTLAQFQMHVSRRVRALRRYLDDTQLRKHPKEYFQALLAAVLGSAEHARGELGRLCELHFDEWYAQSQKENTFLRADGAVFWPALHAGNVLAYFEATLYSQSNTELRFSMSPLILTFQQAGTSASSRFGASYSLLSFGAPGSGAAGGAGGGSTGVGAAEEAFKQAFMVASHGQHSGDARKGAGGESGGARGAVELTEEERAHLAKQHCWKDNLSGGVCMNHVCTGTCLRAHPTLDKLGPVKGILTHSYPQKFKMDAAARAKHVVEVLKMDPSARPAYIAAELKRFLAALDSMPLTKPSAQ